jgi:hypothetical protein
VVALAQETIMALRAGDWIEVRSKEEIFATLDDKGRLDGLPFMPQMVRYCGQRFQVSKRAGKTCSEMTGTDGVVYVGRRLRDTVHLEHRCDGEAHGGCQAGCLIFWKEQWLKRIGASASEAQKTSERLTGQEAAVNDCGRCTEDKLLAATKYEGPDRDIRYSCQATQLLVATMPLKWWDARQYVEAYQSGNHSLNTVLMCILYELYYYGTLARSPRWGKASRWAYDRFQSFWGGYPFPRKAGKIAPGQITPRLDMGLKPGDLVRVKTYEQILETLDSRAYNRGLSFDAELVPYCGKVFKVRTRVERFIDEKTGKMMNMKTPAIILDGVYCQSIYSGKRILCPRGVFLWWREIWLERVSASAAELHEFRGSCPHGARNAEDGQFTWISRRTWRVGTYMPP